MRFGHLSALAVIAFVVVTCGRESQTVTSPDVQSPAALAYAKGEVGRSLVLIVPPAGAEPGQVFTTQPQVEFRPAQGKLLPVGESVTASLVGTGVVLGGTTSVRAAHGTAAFTDLEIPTAGTYTIQFAAPGANSVNATLVVASPCQFSGELIDNGIAIDIDGSGTTATVQDGGGTFAANVTVTPSDCTWEPVSNRSWITINDPGVRTGSGTISYSVDPLAHSSAERSGRITLTVPSGSTGVTFFTIAQVH